MSNEKAIVPAVDSEDKVKVSLSSSILEANVPYSVLARPVQGPLLDPQDRGCLNGPKKNILTGHIELSAINEFDFEWERRKFAKYNTHSPHPPTSLGLEKDDDNDEGDKSNVLPRFKRKVKKRTLSSEDPGDIDGYLGPWAGFIGERKGSEAISTPNEEEVHRYVNEKSRIVPATLCGNISLGQERSIFHGKEERDYLGRTYMSPPTDEGIKFDKQLGTFECFAPKKLSHTWTGHTKGVNSIKFFPKSGHLLLSAGQDQRIKIWDVYRSQECLRTFYGHNKPVREVSFNHDGSQFASCSYDKTIKLWDTESGKCTFAKDYLAIPYCVRIHPDLERSHFLMVGTADKKVLQLDIRSGQIAIEYSRHQGAVNSITFFKQNQSFITSSDDRTLRIWDFEVPKPINIIRDPEMQSMPVSAIHPTEPFIVFQSLANHLAVFALQDSSLSPRNRRFAGHLTSGYACQIGFSPDGKYLFSGDGRGQLIIWAWQNGQLIRRIDAHPQVCIGVEWNPQEASKIATCSWDGTIKYWE